MANNKDYDYQLNLPVGTDFVYKINQLIRKLEKINENDLKVKVDLTGYITSLEIVRDFQKRLISGSNIKTINNQTLLGPGNIKIESEIKRNEFGNLIDLNTSAKNNIVSAVNELDRLIDDLTNSKANKSEVNSTINGINLEISNLRTLINNLSNSKANQSEVNTVKSDLNTVQNKVNTIASSYIKNVGYVESTGLFTFTLQDGTTKSIDLAIEKVVANFTYDSNTNNLILTLADGTKQTVPLTGLIDDFDGVDGQTIKVTVSSDNKISAEVKGKVIGEEHLTDALLNKINEGAGNSVVGPEKYLKDVEYNSSNGIITFTLQDDTKKQVDIPVEKTVKGFEVKRVIQRSGIPTDLTGYEVSVPNGFKCVSSLGKFNLEGSFSVKYYTATDYTWVDTFKSSLENFFVGYMYNSYLRSSSDSVSFLSNSQYYNAAGAGNDFYLTITGGTDTTNQQLIQWFVDNNATFTKNGQTLQGVSVLRLTLNDDTYLDIDLSTLKVDAYSKQESDDKFATKESLNTLNNTVVQNQNTNNTNYNNHENRIKNIETAYVKSVAYEPTAGIFTFTMQDSSVRTVDLAIEKVVTNFVYDESTKSLVLTLADGTKQTVPMSNLIKDYTGKNGDQIQVNISNNEISAILKDGSVTNDKLHNDVKNKIESNTQRITALENSGGSGGVAFVTSISEQVNISSSTWHTLVDEYAPYTHFATLTLTNSVEGKSIMELVNNQPILFAKHGFAIGEIVEANVVIVYSIGQPTENITLTFEFQKAIKVWDGSYTEGAGASLISFTIGSAEYQAEEGMTWEQWVASDYNTDGYVVESLYVRNSNGASVLNNGISVKPTDVIISDNSYTTGVSGGGIN